MRLTSQMQQRLQHACDRFSARRSRTSGVHSRSFPTLRQLKYLPKFFTEWERRLVSIFGAVAVVATVVLIVLIRLAVTVLVPQSGGTYSEALVGPPQHINPLLAPANDTDMDLSALVYSGLMRYDTDRQLVPDLAASYSVSDDELTYTFVLHDDVQWQDDYPLTADDVAFTIESAQDADYGSPIRANFQGVTVNVVDDHTLEIKLAEPFAPFINNLTIGILPAHIWGSILPENANLAERNLKPIGTGSYQFKEYAKDRSGNILSYSLERNDDYYDVPPYIDKLTFRFYPDIASALEAAKKGAVDGVSFIPKTSRDELTSGQKIAPTLLRLPQYTAVFLNQKVALLKDTAIKQALMYGINRDSIVQDILSGEAEVIHGPILPGFVGYNPEIKQYGFDPAKAMEILDEAGWTMDEDLDLRIKDGKELRFTLTTVDQAETVAVANALKNYWEKIGVGVELRLVDGTRIQRTVIKSRDYEALLFGEILGTDPDPYVFWHSSQGRDPGLNLSVYTNNDVDSLLEEARKTSDEDQRRMKYIHFQNLLADDLPALFLYSPTYTYGLGTKVKGFELTRISTPSDRFTDINHWYIKTNRVLSSGDTDTTSDTSASVEVPSDEAAPSDTVDTNTDSGNAEPTE